MRTTTTLLSVFILIFAHSTTTTATCYYADGTAIATDHTPCDTTTAIISCCRPDAFCADDSLCLRGGHYTRGSCTSISWPSPCNKICPTFNTGGSFPVVSCGTDDFYACGVPNPNPGQEGGGGDCQDHKFLIEDGGEVVLRVEQVAGLGLTRPLTPGPTGTVSIAGLVETASASGAASGKKTGSSLTVGAIAGGAVGGVAALVLLVTATVFFWRRRKQNIGRERMARSQQPISVNRDYSRRQFPVEYGGLDLYELPPRRPKGPHWSELENFGEKDNKGRGRLPLELECSRRPAELAS